MALLVLGYLATTEQDWAWMQDIRKQHDQRYFDVVDPHFTLVFPVVQLPLAAFVAHVRTQTEGQGAIAFALRCATVVQDVLSDDAHVFLVPDEGNSAIIKLHDNLYTGVLRPELRLDIPYIPHIGVATTTDITACKALADRLNEQHFCVHGVIDRLDIVRYEHNRVETLDQVMLAR